MEIMRYYPVNLNVRNRPCLVVGGGSVGTRKVTALLDCSARVTLVSPVAGTVLTGLAEENRIVWRQRSYRSGDLDAMFLVIGATDDEDLNRRIHQDAEERRLLCNIADRPEICNFILPSVIRRGDLTIAVSTSGKSPALAKQLRQYLEDFFGPEYEPFLQLMGEVRRRLLQQEHAPEAHKPIFERLIAAPFLRWIREGNTEDIDRFLGEVLGEGYDYRSLMETPDAKAMPGDDPPPKA
jgi:precorrin-2 dehydrogenase/sirohydrochlorin ferrochelatase